MNLKINGVMYDCKPDIVAHIHKLEKTNSALKSENMQLEERLQKVTGAIAKDPSLDFCENKSKVFDDFICSSCNLHLANLVKVIQEKYDDGTVDDEHYIFEPNYCPNCGKKIKEISDNYSEE